MSAVIDRIVAKNQKLWALLTDPSLDAAQCLQLVEEIFPPSESSNPPAGLPTPGSAASSAATPEPPASRPLGPASSSHRAVPGGGTSSGWVCAECGLPVRFCSCLADRKL